MATQFEPPPTYAQPVLIEPITGQATFNPIWLKWFLDVAAFISISGGGGGGGTTHNTLAGLQGGTANEFYHLSNSQTNNLIGGSPVFSGTLTAANLKFGAFTATGGIVQTGFITVTDSGGTSRRLLVG